MEYIVFTDGSTFNNGKKDVVKYGGIGVYIYKPIYKLISIPYTDVDVTNNICELNACIVAIKCIKNLSSYNKELDKIKIYSDSKYVIQSITSWSDNWIKNGWKNKAGKDVKNKELIKRLLDLYNTFTIEMIHVKSHKKQPVDKKSEDFILWKGNNIADKLATDASKSIKNLVE